MSSKNIRTKQISVFVTSEDPFGDPGETLLLLIIASHFPRQTRQILVVVSESQKAFHLLDESFPIVP